MPAPRLSFRIPPALDTALRDEARLQGRSMTDIALDALAERYMESGLYIESERPAQAGQGAGKGRR